MHMVPKLLIVFRSTFKLPKIVLQNTQHFACQKGKGRKEEGGGQSEADPASFH